MPTMHKTKRTQPAKMVTIRIAADDRQTLKVHAARNGLTIAQQLTMLLALAQRG
jgi:predicted DNA binding CopG/RHH family protein